jgi:hypothetical protein
MAVKVTNLSLVVELVNLPSPPNHKLVNSMDSSAAPKPVHLSENNDADRGGDSPPELGTPRWSATKHKQSTSRQPTAALQGRAPEQPSLTPSVPGGIKFAQSVNLIPNTAPGTSHVLLCVREERVVLLAAGQRGWFF